MLQKIKASHLAYRKAKSKIEASLLSTLISDIEKVGKDSIRAVTEADCVAVIRKYITNIEATLASIKEQAPAHLAVELEVLKGLLPEQLTEAQVRAFIEGFVSKCPKAKLGEIMASLKEAYPGRYDGKQASTLAKEILGG